MMSDTPRGCIRVICFGLTAAFLSLAGLPAAGADRAGQRVEFNRDIRPILSDRCFTCHGPDATNRKTPLRFDSKESFYQDLGGRFAVVPGKAEESELIRRIATDDPIRRMPPSYGGHEKLSDREIALMRQWVEDGAQWQGHWSFIAPKRPASPRVSDASWARNPIDAFILERLDSEGLQPSPEADRATLIRRVTLDLTGLPPTIPEIDAFLADSSPNAYEKVAERLLQSPRYGERMAIRWLDAARYADTNGYQTDAERYMWRWRDWVINAFNDNMPFDQFTVEQLAGDLLPHPTLDQRIATGFNRNHRGNGEGGIIAAEYAVEYVVDRVDTTSTVWLGITMGCARCHDHKYDPFTQKEFYQFFAYFNNVPERGKAFKYGNSPPFILAPTPEQQGELKKADQDLAAAIADYDALEAERAAAQREWEASLVDSVAVDWASRDGLVAHYPLDGNLSGDTPGRKPGTTLHPRLLNGMPRFVEGVTGPAADFDGKRFIEVGDIANFGFHDKFTMAAWIYPTSASGSILSRVKERVGGGERGYGMYLKDGKVQANLVTRWLDDTTRVETAEPLALNRWHHVAATYDGSLLATGVKIYVNGKPVKMHVVVDELNQSFASGEPLRIGVGAGNKNGFQGRIDEVRLYDKALSPDDVAILAARQTVNEIAALPPSERTKAQRDKLERCFLDQYSPANIHKAWLETVNLRQQREELIGGFSTVMVMQEMETPRQSHLLIRGAYDKPGEKVSPAVPAALPPLPEGAPNNRLGFARWLVDRANPLTARVIVNRFWQSYFVTGIVKTVEDFGSQGEWPSHMGLLDWLAVEFMESGWDVKALQKTIVMSAAYRQASKVSPELWKRDPENRLLARGPRVRLPAEAVRDQALAVSGLLVEKIGGPSVKPYQPAGLWSELAGGKGYERDSGDNLYRRSIYTFWKRAVPPPSMLNFDSAGREACTVRETRTNTPLQALNLMNDVTFVESSRLLAQRMMTEGGSTPEERIAYGYRLVTAHRPRPEASEILLNSYHHYLDKFQTDRASALLLVSEGEHVRDQALDIAELASCTTVASLILNLDEAITKE